MGRLIVKLVASAGLSAVLTACDRGDVKSDIVLTEPPSEAAVEETFGEAVTAATQADSNSEPRDLAEGDVPPVDFTGEPVPVPAG